MHPFGFCRSLMLLALAAMLAPAGAALAAGDDEFPGVSIPSSPISGSLNSSTDTDDIYAVNVQAGQMIIASITGPSNAQFDLFLYAPGQTNLDDSYVASATATTYPSRLSYIVPTGEGGTYYLDAYAESGSGSYTITYTVRSVGSDDNFPGTSIPSSPIAGSLNFNTDIDDIYRVTLTAGQVIYASVNAASGTQFYISLFNSDATDINVDWEYPVAVDFGSTYPYRLSYVVPVTGTYYLDVYCASGSGNYTVTYTKKTAETDDKIPGATLPSSPAAGSLNINNDTDDFYKVSLAAGQVLYASISGASGTDFGLLLFPPSATDYNFDDTVANDFGTTYPYRLHYTAPAGQGGTYSLNAFTSAGSGSYAITYKVVQGGTDDIFPGKALPAAVASGSLNVDSDYQDIYYVSLAAGQNIQVTLTGGDGSDFDVALFPPGTVDSAADGQVAEASTAYYPETFSYTVPTGKAGKYYLIVSSYQGSGKYDAFYTIRNPNAARNWSFYQ